MATNPLDGLDEMVVVNKGTPFTLPTAVEFLTVRLILFQPFVDTLTDPSLITFVRDKSLARTNFC